MPKDLQEIALGILELPRNQRLALAQFLLNLDEDGAAPDVDAVWDAEIRTRLTAYDAGRVEAISFEQVRRTMAVRFA